MPKPLEDFNNKVEQDKVIRNLAGIELVGTITFIATKDTSEYDTFIKFFLLFSVTLFVMSILAIIRFSLRFEIRYRLLEEEGEQTVKEYSKRISKFAEEGPIKTARMSVLAETAVLLAEIQAEKISNEEKAKKFDELMNKKIQSEKTKSKLKDNLYSKNGYVDSVLDSFLKNLASEANQSRIKYLNRPLDEKYSRLNWLIDMSCVQLRRKSFYLANWILVISIGLMLFK